MRLRPLVPAVILAVACSACARRVAREDPAQPLVSGDRILYPRDAPALGSFRFARVAAATWAAVRTTGRLAWDENVTARIYSPVAGRVRRVLADVQTPVAPGEALAQVDSPDFGQAQADANRAATDYAIADKNRDRLKALFDHGAAARKELEAAEAESIRSYAEKERAVKRLELLGGKVGAVDQHYDLTSPIRGVVVDRAINPGQEIRPDVQTPLYTVSDPTHLWVFLDLTERDLPMVANGMPLVVRTSAHPERVFKGRIDVLGDTLDPVTRTIRARGSVENPDRLLKAEMYVNVEISEPHPKPRLVVPSAAVIGSGEKHWVFVEDTDGTFRRQEVTVGAERSGTTRIEEGLTEGQNVVIEGTLLLQSLLEPRG